MALKHFGSIELINQGSVILRELQSNGVNTITLRAPAIVTSNRTFDLPNTDAANGVISSDGSGVLSIALLANANVAAAAAIAYSKLAALTASRALVSDGSGFVSVATTTSTEIGYVNGVTSAIQTQLDGKEPTITVLSLAKGGTNKAITASAGAVVYSDADSFELSAVGTSGQFLRSNGTAAPSWETVEVSSFKTDWITADGAVKTVTHSLASRDIMVELYDTVTFETVLVDSVVRTDTNTLTLTSNIAPTNTIRVLIREV